MAADKFNTEQWFGIAVIVLVAIGLRPGIVSIGPVLPMIQKEFGLSHAMASLLTTIPDVLMGLLALPAPFIARRLGRDRTLVGALALLCVCIMVRANSPNAAVLLMSTAGVGAGIAIGGTLIAGFIKQNYSRRAALLIGIYATSLSLGSTLSAGLTGVLAGASGSWRVASGVWGILGLLGVAAWVALSARERKSKSPGGLGTSRIQLPLANPTAWLIAIFFACDNLLFYALLSWTAPMYQELGLPATHAGYILASFTAAFMVASPIFGWLGKSEDRRILLALSGAITLAGLIPIALAPTLAPLIFIPITAFGLGAAFTLGMTLPLDNTRGVDEANAWNAFVMTVGYLIASTGPLLTGVLRDLTGNFVLPLWCLVGVAALMLAITPLLRPHRQH